MRDGYRRTLAMVGGLMAVLALSAALASSALAAAQVTRIGTLTPLPAGAKATGAVPASTPLRLTIALQSQDPTGLATFATAVSTPGTPQFRHFLTVPEFAQHYGATPAAVSAVTAALRAQGLTVGAVTRNNLSIAVTGTAAQVENALTTSLSQVTVNGRSAYTNVEAPAVPSSIAKYVQGVIGLSDVTLDQPQGLVTVHRTGTAARVAGAANASGAQAIGNGPAPCPQATQVANAANQYGGTGLGYTADEVAGAYSLNPFYVASDEGAGETVALFEQQPFQASDISTYQTCYSLPTTAPAVVNVDGGPGAYNPTSGDDGEAALDIEQVIGLAPKANIEVFQGPENATSAADILNAMVAPPAGATLPQVISSSWGVCEALTQPAVIQSENTALQEAATQGQSFYISSGDSGAEMCYQATAKAQSPNFSLSVIDPGGQPFATGVGGTSLGNVVNQTWVLPDNGSYPSEFVWNDGVPGGQVGDSASGSGGGVSDQWAMPSYQSGAPGSLNVIGTGSTKACDNQFCRQVPDVSAAADPNSGYVVFANGGQTNGGWTSIGGTSAAAPMWAAMTALINASPSCRGLSVGFVNPALYQIAGSSYLTNFHDITAADGSPFTGLANNDTFGGGNTDDPNQLYPLGTGYDMATGLGTPIGSALGASLCALDAPAYSVSVASPGSQSSAVGHAVLLQVHGSDSGGAALAYAASGLPAGLTMNGTNGVISGTTTTPGTSTVTVSAGDHFKNSGSTVFSWTVVKPGPPSLKGSFGGLTNRKPKLGLTVRAGANAPAIKSFTVSLPGGLSFAKKTKGITVKAGGKKVKATLKVSHGKLTVTLPSAATSVSVTIAKPAISESSSLATKVRKHKVKTLSVGVNVTDAAGHATKLTAKPKA